MIEIVAKNDASASSAVSEKIREATSPALKPELAAKSFCACIQQHISAKYPNSKHWDPRKVTYSGVHVYIDIPGASRAYEDITIVPRFKKKLAIPFNVAAGTKPSDWTDAFIVKKRNGNMFLAQSNSSNLVALFALVDRAFQPRDPSLLPTDEELAKAYEAELDKTLQQGH